MKGEKIEHKRASSAPQAQGRGRVRVTMSGKFLPNRQD
jgi:cyanate lyase